MNDLDVIDDPATAVTALEPMRARILAALAEPASAAALAERVGITRQKVNYHLRALERHGLVRLAETRKWGGLTERRMVASASSYVVSPEALGEAANDPEQTTDRLSARYLIALGARIVREVAGLVKQAEAEDKRLSTLSLDTELRFRSAEDRAAFSDELSSAIRDLVSRYHDESAPPARAYRLIVGAHPIPKTSKRKGSK